MAVRRAIPIARALAGTLLRRPLLTVAVAAAAVRVPALLQIPLVITNDGVGYAQWAISILHGDFPDLPIFRTPGYPLFLAALFAAAGVGPIPVLVAQHALGVATCTLIAATARRIAGPGLALVCGLLATLDPRLLGFESYLLTETLATFLVIAAAAVALASGRPVLRAAALGAAIAALCLVRPAFQVAAPFLGLALVLSLDRSRRLPAAAALVGVAGALLAPWLAHNLNRGVPGISGANSVFRWLGARQAGLIDGRIPPPEQLREPFERLLLREPAHSDAVYPFLVQCGAWDDPNARAALDEWVWTTVRARPGAYAGAIGTALLWQLDLYPASGAVRRSELRWYLRRLGGPPRPRSDAPNFQFNTPSAPMEAFAMHDRPGPAARMIGASAALSGAVNAILFTTAVAAGAFSLARRRWSFALVLMATGAYFAAHVVMLLPYSRFSLPVWTAWYLAPAILASCRFRTPSPAPTEAATDQKNSSRPLGREP